MRYRTLNYDPVKSGNIIYACAVLHNICITLNDEPPNEDNEIDDNDVLDNNAQVLGDYNILKCIHKKQFYSCFR